MNTDDVIVIGGGIIGLSIARALAKRGVKVRVLEAGEPGPVFALLPLTACLCLVPVVLKASL